ncbi:MAG TPA: hypothetical protein V6D08_20350 [Candidatus Obscuribacterales bacterium]
MSPTFQHTKGRGKHWARIYESSFPESERISVSEIRADVSSGYSLLHETRVGGKTVCFSVVELVSPSNLLLSYFAADPQQRSRGIGTWHMQQLIADLKERLPQATALFLEIESRKQAGLTAEQQEERRRRAAFYERLGAKTRPGFHFSPDLTNKTELLEFELMWLELGEVRLSKNKVDKALHEIHTISYGLGAEHPAVKLS